MGLRVDRVADNVVARTELGRPQRLILAGHTDTVPPAGNDGATVDGDRVSGVGACDMKGGLAVFLAVARELTDPAVDVTWVFYAGEEIAAEHNGLRHLFAERPDLVLGDAALVGEPSSGDIEAGCQGTIRARVTFRGARAHTARPWMGINAIHRLHPVLSRLDADVGRRPVLDGCEYREATQAVSVSGGVAGNVVPDEAILVINHRFAPDRSSAAATAHLRDLVGEADGLEIVDLAPAAPPRLDHPLLRALIDRNGLAVRAKLGWTDVARFAEHGVPAVNFGPGDAHLAHTPTEYVERTHLESVHAAVTDLVGRGRGP